jgi:hypothetical protein
MTALGFHDMDSKEEAVFIEDSIAQSMKDGLVLRHKSYDRGVVIIRVSNSTGVYVYGRFEDNTFVYEYHFPFVIGSRITENDEVTVERHLDKESYAVICDEMNTGVTLIFYLQNVMDYMEFISKQEESAPIKFNPDRRNAASRNALKGKKTILTALSLGGMILLPIDKRFRDSKHDKEDEKSKRNLIAAAKRGDESAIESLTLDDIDTYTEISHRIMHEDVFTIVDSTFMPCGVECDQYSVIGEILELSYEKNTFTDEQIVIMTLECNSFVFTMAINHKDLLGEPKIGRRFKGQIWLQGSVGF